MLLTNNFPILSIKEMLIFLNINFLISIISNLQKIHLYLPIISFKTPTIQNTIGQSGVLFFNNFNKNTLKQIILKNCFDKKKYQLLKDNINKNNKYLTNKESAKLFIKALHNA